jgi:hypothetical protein
MVCRKKKARTRIKRKPTRFVKDPIFTDDEESKRERKRIINPTTEKEIHELPSSELKKLKKKKKKKRKKEKAEKKTDNDEEDEDQDDKDKEEKIIDKEICIRNLKNAEDETDNDEEEVVDPIEEFTQEEEPFYDDEPVNLVPPLAPQPPRPKRFERDIPDDSEESQDNPNPDPTRPLDFTPIIKPGVLDPFGIASRGSGRGKFTKDERNKIFKDLAVACWLKQPPTGDIPKGNGARPRKEYWCVVSPQNIGTYQYFMSITLKKFYQGIIPPWCTEDWDIELTATNANGSDTEEKRNFIQAKPKTGV